MANYIFVYGTLKAGEHNNDILDGCEYVGKGIARGFLLIEMGGFNCL